MKEYAGVAFNELLYVDEGKIDPRAEMILLFAEPKWDSDASGPIRRRTLGDYRLLLSSKGLRALAEAATERADGLDAISAATAGITVPSGR